MRRGEDLRELKQYQYWHCKDEGVHLPVTLDEYCNPTLGSEILNIRNKDQVVLRYQRNRSAGRLTSDELLSVITVPQAWLWKVNGYIITTLPPNIAKNVLFHRMLDSWDLSDDSMDTYGTEHVLGMFLSDLVDVLDRPATAGLSEPLFNIFEKSIADLSEQVNNYIKFTSVDTISIEEEKQFLHKIDDIREELSMIKTVLFQQEDVWKDFANKAWPSYWPDGPDGRFKPPERPEPEYNVSPKTQREIWTKIQKPQLQFAKFKRRIAKLDADAERVERAIDRKLDLKAKHASLNEAHTMAVMSAAVFGFTIITIIFTPLSFIVTLFALPIDRLQQHQVPSVWTDQAGMYSTNYLGKWIGEYSR